MSTHENTLPETGIGKPTEIEVTRDDLVLALAGYKTMHFISGDQLPASQLIYLTHGEGEQKLIVPVIAKHCTPDNRNGGLNEREIEMSGRFTRTSPPPARMNVSEATLKKRERVEKQKMLRAEENPLLFAALEHAGDQAPEEIYPQDFVAKNAVGQLHRLEFSLPDNEMLHLPLSAWKQFKPHYARAYQTLRWPVCAAHNYVFYRPPHVLRADAIDMPDAPLGNDCLLALRYLKAHQQSSLEDLLARMSAPGNQARTKTTVPYYAPPSEPPYPESEGRWQEMAGYPMARSSLATGILAAGGAIKRMASLTPPTESKPQHHSKGRPDHSIFMVKARNRGDSRTSYKQYDFEIPLAQPNAIPVTSFTSSEITEEIARAHGYLSVKSMRIDLNLNGHDVMIYSRPVAPIRPEDLGMIPKERRATALLDIRSKLGAAWNSGIKPVQPAKEYAATLDNVAPEENLPNFEQFLRIIMPPAQFAAAGIEASKLGVRTTTRRTARAAPSEVIVARLTPEIAAALEEEKLSDLPPINYHKGYNGKVTEGPGWTFTPAPKEKVDAQPQPSEALSRAEEIRKQRLSETPLVPRSMRVYNATKFAPDEIAAGRVKRIKGGGRHDLAYTQHIDESERMAGGSGKKTRAEQRLEELRRKKEKAATPPETAR